MKKWVKNGNVVHEFFSYEWENAKIGRKTEISGVISGILCLIFAIFAFFN